MTCNQCRMVQYITVFPYHCSCGKVYGEAASIPPIPKPGTRLKELISWFPIPRKENCQSCRNLEDKMNRWGPEKCREKLPYITRKLEIAAKRRHLPYNRRLVQILINRAINNAVVSSDNHSSKKT